VDPSEFLSIGNKFVNLQRYKDCFFPEKIKNLIFLKIILIKHLDKGIFFKKKGQNVDLKSAKMSKQSAVTEIQIFGFESI
jgi:hypothetical protein